MAVNDQETSSPIKTSSEKWAQKTEMSFVMLICIVLLEKLIISAIPDIFQILTEDLKAWTFSAQPRPNSGLADPLIGEFAWRLNDNRGS